jgi:hypothetical protein
VNAETTIQLATLISVVAGAPRATSFRRGGSGSE